MRHVLLAALLLVTALAGCSDSVEPTPPPTPEVSPLSQAQHRISAPAEVWVTASDGARLNNAVYRPDTDEPVPVFINFSPYWGDTAMTQGDAFAQYMIAEYVPRGYAVVLSAIRGTGHSEGCFEIGSDRESLDVSEVVDFFAREPWSSGAIAAGGKSYDSTSQNGMIAKFPHPALKGIFHVSGITDMYRYSYKDGVSYTNGPEFTSRYFATQGLDEYVGATNGAGSGTNEDPDSLARVLDDATCAELPNHSASSLTGASAGIKDAYWQERDWNRDIAASSWNGSIFFVHGLQDWNVKPDHILPWLDNMPADVKVLGWLHQWQQDGTGHVYPMRQDWNLTMLRWLDHTLKGLETGMDQLWGYEAQGTDGVWRRSEAWPPNTGTYAPPLEQLAAGRQSVTYRAEALGIRIAGTPVVHLEGVAHTADPIVTANLYAVGPDGERWIGGGARRLAVSDDLQSPKPFTPNSPFSVDVTFYPLDFSAEPSDRELILVVGLESNEPEARLSPASFVILPAQSAISYSAAATALTLPTAPGPGISPQPLPMACFTC